MIPDAAVEAAAEWLPHSGDCEVRPGRDCTCWQSSVNLMRAALEAAAPHMRQAFFLEMNLKAVREEMANTIYPLGKIEDKRT